MDTLRLCLKKKSVNGIGHWYGKMCEKFGQDHVDENYCFEDCLTDWTVVNWAWESTNE